MEPNLTSFFLLRRVVQIYKCCNVLKQHFSTP
jgi:hypothetical protein